MSFTAPRIFVLTLAVSITAIAQTASQPTIWASKPDVAGFEKIVNGRLTSADSAIAQLTSYKGPRTIDNTVAPFDEAVRHRPTAVDQQRPHVTEQVAQDRILAVEGARPGILPHDSPGHAVCEARSK